MVTLVWSGLTLGAVYALLAIAFNVVYTTVGVFNFAQGAFATVAVLLAYAGGVLHLWSPPVVVIVAVAVCAILALAEAWIVLQPRALGHNELLTTVGISTTIVGVAAIVWGSDVHRVPARIPNPNIRFAGGVVQPNQLVVIGLAVVIGVGLRLYYRHTLSGQASLAIAEDKHAAALRGINVRRKSYEAFLIAGAVAGVSGLFVAPETFAYPDVGSAILLPAFVGFVFGGAGDIVGGVVGCLLLGLIQQFTARYLGVLYENMVLFAVLLIVLTVLPNGLFGMTKRRTV